MSKNNFLASKLALAVLGFAITIFLACSDHPTLKFPEDELPSSSSSETAVSSSSSESSSSVASSSSSESSSSSLKECEVSFNHNNKFCYDGTVYDKCDGLEYIPTSEICSETGLIIPAKCNGNSYNPLTHYCHTDGETYSCGDKPYNPSTHFCYGNSKIVVFCGDRKHHYDPDKYECRATTNPNGIYLKGGLKDSRDGKTYDAVLIGEQTWMAANLNYKTPNNASRCYPLTGNSNSNDNDNANCTNADGTAKF
jgi:hypothetical protein